MMNHIVPDFETGEDFIIPEMPKKSTMGGDEDIMELLWHNGQVVMQSQNQRSVTNKKQETIRSSVGEEDTRPAASGMFMQEEEMSPWLHYPIDDDNPLENYLYDHDTIYPSPTPAVTAPASSSPITAAAVSLPPPPPPPPSVVIPSRPPVPPYRRSEVDSVQPKNTNFSHFTRHNKIRIPELGSELCLHNCNKIPPVLQSATTVGSNVAPTVTPAVNVSESRVSRVSEKRSGVCGGGGAGGTSSAGREMETCEVSMTSSPGSGGSGASGSMGPMCQKLPAVTDDRKRKGVDADDNDCHIEDAEFEYADAKKQSHAGSTSTKRSRAAEVHNLSERRRRDRINEKMKALQELIPRCNKSDKASMLDEAIEYLKSLQMQVQMMSMGCNMFPMMFPGVQQYMQPMAMGIGMGMAGMGMGMDMGMNRAMVPYPSNVPGSSLPNPAAAATTHLGQRFPVPGFNMSPVIVAGSTVSQAANMPDPTMNPLTLNSQNQPRVPNFPKPFQQHFGLHQTQIPLPQTQGGVPTMPTNRAAAKMLPTPTITKPVDDS